MNYCAFPTLGEAMKALFDVTGILSHEEDPLDEEQEGGKDEKTRKSIQAQLRRLAIEEGSLDENLFASFELLEGYLDKIFDDSSLTDAFMKSVDDAFIQYKHLIRTEGACLPKDVLIKWLVELRLPSRVLMSSHKNCRLYNVAGSGLEFPSDPNWWIPSFENGKIVWPLKKTYSWIYEVTKTNQTHFHYPNYNEDLKIALDPFLLQSKRNAPKWSASEWKGNPRLSVMFDNLDASLNALRKCSNTKYRREIDLAAAKSFKVALFIGRMATAFFKWVRNTFGQEFLIAQADIYAKQNYRLSREMREFDDNVRGYIAALSVSRKENIDEIWFNQTRRYWRNLANNTLARSEELQIENDKMRSRSFDFARRKHYVSTLGAFEAYFMVQYIQYDVGKLYSEGAPLFVRRGEELKCFVGASTLDLYSYQKQVENAGLMENIGWMVNWVFANWHYFRGDLEEAFKYLELAYKQARYTAGSAQNKLVVQYIELAAMCGKKREFKKGLAWAEYLRIEPPKAVQFYSSEEALPLVFEEIKRTGAWVL